MAHDSVGYNTDISHASHRIRPRQALARQYKIAVNCF